MKARYIIRHHPNLFTEILVQEHGTDRPPVQIEHRFSWADSREYCRVMLEQRGIEPTIERPEKHTEVFPWIEV